MICKNVHHSVCLPIIVIDRHSLDRPNIPTIGGRDACQGDSGGPVTRSSIFIIQPPIIGLRRALERAKRELSLNMRALVGVQVFRWMEPRAPVTCQSQKQDEFIVNFIEEFHDNLPNLNQTCQNIFQTAAGR